MFLWVKSVQIIILLFWSSLTFIRGTWYVHIMNAYFDKQYIVFALMQLPRAIISLANLRSINPKNLS